MDRVNIVMFTTGTAQVFGCRFVELVLSECVFQGALVENVFSSIRYPVCLGMWRKNAGAMAHSIRRAFLRAAVV